MKQLFLHLGVYVVLLLVVTSCSNSSNMMSDLLENVPADVDVVVVGDVKTIIESAGGLVDESKLNLPTYITDELSGSDLNEFDEFRSFLKGSGVNIETCAVVLDYKHSYPIFICALNDVDKFKKVIEREGFRERESDEDVIFYTKKVYESSLDSSYDDYGYIAIKDSYVYWIKCVWVGSDFKAERTIKRLIDDANENPFAGTVFSEYIVSGNAGGVAIRIPSELRRELIKAGISNDVADLYDGVICMKGDLSDSLVEINMKWFDENGQAKNIDELGKYIDLNAKINQQALAFMNKDEFLISAMSIKDMDWERYMDLISENVRLSRSDKATLTILKSYLEKLDGTVAVGFGFTDGLASIFKISQKEQIFNELSITVVCETKSGKANGLINDIKGLLDTKHVEYEDLSKGLIIDIPEEGLKLYMQAKDNIIVISNHEIKDDNNNETVENINFKDNILTVGMVLSRNRQLMRDLRVKHGIEASLSFDIQQLEATMKVAIGGNESVGVIGRFITMILDVVGQEERIKNEWGNLDYDLSNYEDIDTLAFDEIYADSVEVVVDTVAVVDVE